MDAQIRREGGIVPSSSTSYGYANAWQLFAITVVTAEEQPPVTTMQSTFRYHDDIARYDVPISVNTTVDIAVLYKMRSGPLPIFFCSEVRYTQRGRFD